MGDVLFGLQTCLDYGSLTNSMSDPLTPPWQRRLSLARWFLGAGLLLFLVSQWSFGFPEGAMRGWLFKLIGGAFMTIVGHPIAGQPLHASYLVIALLLAPLPVLTGGSFWLAGFLSRAGALRTLARAIITVYVLIVPILFPYWLAMLFSPASLISLVSMIFSILLTFVGIYLIPDLDKENSPRFPRRRRES